jgi:hypothetical protein
MIMTDPTAVKRAVRLKRTAALVRGDVILPGLGLFDRAGNRIVPAAETFAWGRGSWFVVGHSWMNDALENNVPLSPTASYVPSDILHTPLDAYVVLA